MRERTLAIALIALFTLMCEPVVNPYKTPPSSLDYPETELSVIVGDSLPPQVPSFENPWGEIAFSVSPALPGGFTLDSGTGTLTGRASTPHPRTQYAIDGRNPFGADTVLVWITVLPVPLRSLEFTNGELVLTVGDTAAILPALAQGVPDSFSITPQPPMGLSFDPKTGALSGVAQSTFARTRHTIRASNASGSIEGILFIEIREAPADSSVDTTVADSNFTDTTAVDTTTSDTTSSDTTASDTTSSDTTSSDTTSSDTTSSDTTSSDTTASDTTASDTTASDTTASDTTSSDTTASDTTSSDTTSSDTTSSDTTSSDTTSSDTTASDTTSSDTTAIDTTTDTTGTDTTQAPTIKAPRVLDSPDDAQVVAGESLVLSGLTSGDSLRIRWFRDGLELDGKTALPLVIDAVTHDDNGDYFFIVTNTIGADTSAAARVTVESAPTPPSITVQPRSITRIEGDTAGFTVVASGTSLSYQWRKNGNPLAGAAEAALVIDQVQFEDSGATYSCIVSNTEGRDTSDGAVLTVKRLPAAPTISSVATAEGSATLTWQAAARAQSYNLYYAADDTVSSTNGTKVENVVSSHTVTGLADGTVYAFALSSVNDNGESALSPVSTASTPRMYTVRASVGASGGTVSPSGEIRVAEGESLRFTFAPEAGYGIDAVLVDGVVDSDAAADGEFTFSGITSDHGLEVRFALKTFSLTTSMSADVPGVTGSISQDPAGSQLDSGTVVTLVAPTSDSRYSFSAWTDGAGWTDSSTTSQFILTGNRALTAAYQINTYSLTTAVSPAGAGSVSRDPDTSTFTHGESVTLTATAGSGYAFSSWSGDASGGSSTTSITMTNDKSATANFDVAAPSNVTVTVDVSPVLCVDTARFEVSATGIGTFSYQWQEGTGNISGATSATYRYAPAPGENGQKTFRCIVSNSGGSTISSGVTLTVVNAITYNGDSYEVLRIGEQVWTKQNLRATEYNDGTAIPHVTDPDQWQTLTTPAYCFYDNATDASLQAKWGALYNWYAASAGGLAPQGWHVSDSADWAELEDYLIANGYNWDGSRSGNKIAKSLAAQSDWFSSTVAGSAGNNPNTNNTSGFSAFPSGALCYYGDFSDFCDNGDLAVWWNATQSSASNGYARYIGCADTALTQGSVSKRFGYSVRLVRD